MTQPKLRFKREDGTSYPDWKSGIIGDYYAFKNGLNKDKTAFGKGTPIINYTDVFKNRLLTTKIIKGRVTLNEKEIENHSAKLGDVFFTRTSETLDEVGFCGALIEDIPNCVFSGFLLRGRPIDTSLIAPNFAGYYFMTMPIRQEIISKSSITTRALTNGRNLSAVKIKMPCLEEQQKIANCLSIVDEVITQSETEVQNLEQQKKAAMQKIFLQEVRFRRENGTEFPEWEEKSLKDCTNFIKDGTHGTHKDVEQGYYLLSAKDVFNGAIHIGEDSRIISQDDFNSIYKQYSLAVGDVILTIVGTLGRTAVITEKYVKVVFQRSVAILRPNSLTDSYYLRYTMENNSFQNELEIRKSKGAQAGVYLGTLAEIEIPFPCLEEQQKIADFLSAYDDAISYAKQELDKWKELKKGLLQQMFV